MTPAKLLASLKKLKELKEGLEGLLSTLDIPDEDLSGVKDLPAREEIGDLLIEIKGIAQFIVGPTTTYPAMLNCAQAMIIRCEKLLTVADKVKDDDFWIATEKFALVVNDLDEAIKNSSVATDLSGK